VWGGGGGGGDGGVEECQATGGRVVKFNALRQFNRSALTLSGDRVYVLGAPRGDTPPYHGWVVAFNKATLAIEAVFNVSPNGRWGGIWQSGGGRPVDEPSKLTFFPRDRKF